MLCESLPSFLAPRDRDATIPALCHCAGLRPVEILLTRVSFCSRIVNLGVGALMVASGIFHFFPIGL
jgi:hypothetical protein